MAPIIDHLFNPNGRIGRKTFILSAAGFIALGIVCTLVPVAGQIVSLVMLWPWTIIAIKRLHDMNRGATPAIFMAIASASFGTAGTVVSLLALNPGLFLVVASVMAIAGLIVGFVAIAFVVWLAVSTGTSGSNRYGSPEAGAVAFMTYR